MSLDNLFVRARDKNRKNPGAPDHLRLLGDVGGADRLPQGPRGHPRAGRPVAGLREESAAVQVGGHLHAHGGAVPATALQQPAAAAACSNAAAALSVNPSGPERYPHTYSS